MTISDGTVVRARAAFDALLTSSEPLDVVRAHPVLLRPEVREAVVDPSLPREVAAQDLLERLSQAFNADYAEFSVGSGPVERLWAEVEQGNLGADAARSAARSLTITEHLAPAYVLALFSSLQQPAAVFSTWRATRERGRILNAALAASGRIEHPHLRSAASFGRLMWVHGLLISVPDGAALREADEAGAALLADTDSLSAIGVVAADVEFELAATWGDPYVAGRGLVKVEGGSNVADKQHEIWVLRGVAENSDQDGRQRSEWAMPEPAEALATSLAHWRSANVLAPGRGSILVGLAEAGAFLSSVTGNPPDPAVVQAITEGLSLASISPALRARFDGMAHYYHLERPAGGDSSGLDVAIIDSDTLIGELGSDAGPTAAREFERLARADPKRALAIAERHLELFRDPAHVGDQIFRIFAQRLIAVLNSIYGTPAAEIADATPEEFQKKASAVYADITAFEEDAEPDAAHAVRVASTLLRLALSAAQNTSERLGLLLLERHAGQAPLFARRYEWLAKVIRADLLLGEGVNCVNRGERTQAIPWYVASLRQWADIGREEPVVDLLGLLADLATDADDSVESELVGSLAGLAPQLDALGGQSVPYVLGVLYRRVVGRMVERERANSELMWGALQFAKGHRTAMLLQRQSAGSLREDPALASLLERLVNAALTAEGSRSLRGAFERRRRQLISSGTRSVSLLSLEETSNVLDARSVLLTTWTVEYANGQPARIAYLVDESEPTLSSTGALEDSSHIPLWPEWMGELLSERADLGRDHLCVIAESAVASVPWHTLSLGDGVLADHWIVTLLPHPHFLLEGRRGPKVARHRASPMLALGLDDAGGTAVKLPNAEAEAEAVTAPYAGAGPLAPSPPLVGPNATREAFARLAPNARRIHIASHGLSSPDAPSFHSLLLADGQLAAWEVAELDLQQVDLVTLSACDSAELYPGEADNLEGLPMAFLMAGARTVIGCSAPIRTDASQLFFEELHRQIAAGTTDLRDAFRAAQTATRTRFPDPEVWGAFYLLGDWW